MRKLLLLLFALAMAWGLGLLAFAGHVRSQAAPEKLPTAQAIVVLTGRSGERLRAAAGLLRDGRGERMLVSGVNRQATRADIRAVTGLSPDLFACCVDLGFAAKDTRGNGEEIGAWARAHDYRTLIVVTADYHMPRALLELRADLRGARLIPYPVRTSEIDVRRWLASGPSSRRMTLEYCKFLAAAVRGVFSRPSRPQAENKAP